MLLVDQRDRTYLFAARDRRDLPHAQRHAPARRADRRERGHPAGDDQGHGARRVPAPVRRLRAEDAARRPGGLPEGPRADRDLRRRVPGGPRARGRHGLGRAHDRAVPRRRRRRDGSCPTSCATSIARQAIENIEAFFGAVPDTLKLRSGDLAEVAGTGERYDRAVLDMPEPWGPLPALREVLEPGGIVCAYLPTTVQVQQLVLALPGNGFQHLETFETLKPGVARHRAKRASRPPHGRAHGVPHDRPPRGVSPHRAARCRGGRVAWSDRRPEVRTTLESGITRSARTSV